MVGYFEIAVADLERAVSFYKSVFDVEFMPFEIHGNTMAHFPDPDEPGKVTGALSMGDAYVPGTSGTIIYFAVKSVASTLQRAIDAGGSELFPPTSAGDFGIVAEFMDSEGNRIGLTGPA